MPLAINTNISALQALGTKQATTANNIANVASPEFKKSTTLLQAGQSGTVSAKTRQVNTPGVMLNQADGSMKELSNVDLAQELTDMIPTKHGYAANVKALQVQGEMEDSVLDILG